MITHWEYDETEYHFFLFPRYRQLTVSYWYLKSICVRQMVKIRIPCRRSTFSFLKIRYLSPIFRVIHTICPEWPACHPQGGGGGWQATRPVSRVKWLWRHRQTRRNGNVARLDSSNFPTFTSENTFWDI